MKIVIHSVLFLIAIFVQSLTAQDWHKIYFPDRSNVTNSVFESYDRGYILGGDFEFGGVPTNGLIIKTDINGEILWNKTVSNANDFTSVYDINQTSVNGSIITGVTGEQTNFLNPFIMKLNPCAQNEWCRIFNLQSTAPE
ncbi:MAG: hypothetical protein M0Q38_14700 [Bacteroidales bacterium]|jgi:hypothetical protein|nr:hypothetical protein [Bacteroidales bacterium]